MNMWPNIGADYAAWLRSFPMLTQIGTPGDPPEVVSASDDPVFLDVPFWSARTHDAEARARRHLTDPQIDGIIDEVAAIIDEDLLRFDPLVAYYGRFAPDGDPMRIAWESEGALSVKRDLGWAAIEQAIGEQSFFCGLLPWYNSGRWPVGWAGKFPMGRLQVV